MKFYNSVINDVRSFLYYAKNHRIATHPESRINGIIYTIIGWAIISFVEVFLNSDLRMHSGPGYEWYFNFLIAFFSGTLLLYVFSLFFGFTFLKVSELKESNYENDFHHITHLPVKERKLLLFLRGSLSIIGFLLYSWSTSTSQTVNNSVAFSSDAVMYLLLMIFVLKQKTNKWQWLSILITFSGVCLIGSLDFIDSHHVLRSINSLFLGLVSAGILAVIILLNTVIVQHDPPLRIAFYQCLIGFVIFSVIIGIWTLFDPGSLNILSLMQLKKPITWGCLYAIALIFFFKAFLYTEPLIIVILGYSSFVFSLMFSWMSGSQVLGVNLLGSLLILSGGILAILQQYNEDKNQHSALVTLRPIYLASLSKKFKYLHEEFKNGGLNLLEYISQRHEFNKLLIEFSKHLKLTDIQKIEIDHSEVVFTFNLKNIKLITDGGCRSVPFEVLNLGQYEKFETEIITKLIDGQSVILDVGANLGWHSIYISKCFPSIIVYAFEPVPQTFSLLKKNLILNDCRNVKAYNLALGNKLDHVELYYFQGGSAVASQKNLLNHDKVQKILCPMVSIDSFFSENLINKLDFIKCDAEGSELEVITGGISSINKFKPIIFAELYHGWCKKFGYKPNDIYEILQKVGYICYEFREKSLLEVTEIPDNSKFYNYLFFNKNKNSHLEMIKTLESLKII